MNIRTFAAFLVGALLGAALAKLIRNRGIARIRIRRHVSGDPETIVGLISQVEREPELIPFVRSVEVVERRGDSVRYRAGFGLGYDAVQAAYCKSWDLKKRRVEWHSESGPLGMTHSGRIAFRSTPQGPLVELNTEYRFATPVLGPLLAAASEWPVAAALSAWLRHLDREARQETAKLSVADS